MSTTANPEEARRRIERIVILYPVGILLVSLALNLFAFGVSAVVVALPGAGVMRALVVAAVLLVVNHTWLMTTTELTRGRFKMYATPEEWVASGTRPEDAPREGILEVRRHHNAHRNATENTVYFALLALLFAVASPPAAAAYVWIPCFAISRLGYTWSYLSGRDGARGLFMTFGLLALYGMGSWLALSLVM